MIFSLFVLLLSPYLFELLHHSGIRLTYQKASIIRRLDTLFLIYSGRTSMRLTFGEDFITKSDCQLSSSYLNTWVFLGLSFLLFIMNVIVRSIYWRLKRSVGRKRLWRFLNYWFQLIHLNVTSGLCFYDNTDNLLAQRTFSIFQKKLRTIFSLKLKFRRKLERVPPPGWSVMTGDHFSRVMFHDNPVCLIPKLFMYLRTRMVVLIGPTAINQTEH